MLRGSDCWCCLLMVLLPVGCSSGELDLNDARGKDAGGSGRPTGGAPATSSSSANAARNSGGVGTGGGSEGAESGAGGGGEATGGDAPGGGTAPTGAVGGTSGGGTGGGSSGTSSGGEPSGGTGSSAGTDSGGAGTGGAITDCDSGFADCNGDADDGCEADLYTDSSHCGFCGKTCPGDEICIAGDCGCASALVPCAGECVDVSSDRNHCGTCDSPCGDGQGCTGGQCGRPCDGTCPSPEAMTTTDDGFRVEPLGTTARCFEVVGYDPSATNPRLVCWPADSGRTFQVNGQTLPCVDVDGAALPSPRFGGYCVQVMAGSPDWGGILLPTE